MLKHFNSRLDKYLLSWWQFAHTFSLRWHHGSCLEASLQTSSLLAYFRLVTKCCNFPLCFMCYYANLHMNVMLHQCDVLWEMVISSVIISSTTLSWHDDKGRQMFVCCGQMSLADLINEFIPQLLFGLLVCCHGGHGGHGYFGFPKGMKISRQQNSCLQGFLTSSPSEQSGGFCRTVGNLSGLNCFSARLLWKSGTVCFCAHLLACGVLSRALMWTLC